MHRNMWSTGLCMVVWHCVSSSLPIVHIQGSAWQSMMPGLLLTVPGGHIVDGARVLDQFRAFPSAVVQRVVADLVGNEVHREFVAVVRFLLGQRTQQVVAAPPERVHALIRHLGLLVALRQAAHIVKDAALLMGPKPMKSTL